MSETTKEDIYDEQIAPLMTKIIEICKQHKIAMLADFHTPNEDASDLHCTTALLIDEHEPSDGQLKALRCLRPTIPVTLAETHTTKPDGSTRVSIRRIT